MIKYFDILSFNIFLTVIFTPIMIATSYYKVKQ